jgi:ATP-dependent RNA helicase DDX24/MAK5
MLSLPQLGVQKVEVAEKRKIKGGHGDGQGQGQGQGQEEGEPKKKKRKKGNKNKNKNAIADKNNEDNDEKRQETEVVNADLSMSAWNELFVPEPVLRALRNMGFSIPTEIQSALLPAAIKGRMDVMGAAETGSGKTLAFGIPILHGILADKKREKDKEQGRNSPIAA